VIDFGPSKNAINEENIEKDLSLENGVEQGCVLSPTFLCL
jgi:hypothetical protein